MNDQMPDFDPTPDLEPAAPKKERKKPQKSKTRAGTMRLTAQTKRKKRRVMKVKAVRRGRPPGALNKPKAEQIGEATLSPAVYDVLATLIKMSKEERAQVALHMKGLFR